MNLYSRPTIYVILESAQGSVDEIHAAETLTTTLNLVISLIANRISDQYPDEAKNLVADGDIITRFEAAVEALDLVEDWRVEWYKVPVTQDLS